MCRAAPYLSVFEERMGFHLRVVGVVQVASKTSLNGGRDKFTVFAQAVTTTPETEAEADTTAESTVPETSDDAPAPAVKSKKLTTRVKHIMEVSSSRLPSPISAAI